MSKMDKELKHQLKNDLRFAKNLIIEAQIVMDRICKNINNPEEVKSKIRCIHEAVEIDVHEFERIISFIKKNY